MIKDYYQFHKQLLIRIPAQPFEVAISAACIEESLHDARFVEGIYLASPALHEECDKWRRGELIDARKIARLRSTLTRYYVRSRSRCTPFGLFAGCAVATWDETTNITPIAGNTGRHTRLDMHYLCALTQQLAAHPAIRSHLYYRPNTSLYPLGDEMRFVEYHYVASRRVHQLSAVATSIHLHEVLAAARKGTTYSALVSLLRMVETEPGEAEDFIKELIEAQVLVHEMEPTVTGKEYFSHIQAVLSRLVNETSNSEISAIAKRLEDVRQQLDALDRNPTNAATSYEHIVATLTPLGVPLEPGKLFQTDATPNLGKAPTLNRTFQREVLEALEVLNCLAPPPVQPRLITFRDRFLARYETQEIPLLEALDNESGISYTTYGKSSYSPLVHDLVTVSASASTKAPLLTKVQQLLYEKLRQAERKQEYSLDLTAEELRQVTEPAVEPLPPSLAVVFRVLADQRILVESASGSSAVNLIGRFAHAEPAIAQLIQQVTQREQEHNPAVAFAEICHLPTSRTGNLLQRPSFRDLEIPYLAQSTLPIESQVLPQDLLLSVQQGQFVLRSRVTGQRIIPRLSTAHNFAYEALPVYQFLCDLQTQGVQAQLGFNWTSVSSYTKFLPRLTYRNLVLVVASWKLDATDLAPLFVHSAAFDANWRAFRQQWHLPRFFTLADGDNELLVDAENDTLVAVWLDTIRHQQVVQLKEFLFDPAASPVRDAAGKPYVQQIVAVLLHQRPSYPSLPYPSEVVHAAPVQREFSLGSEWLYYKLYCGQKVANQVLLGVVQPLIEELLAHGLIDNWFFIRYADPDHHLRLRMHLPASADLGVVVRTVFTHLEPYHTSSAVWKVQTDTYRRELERYGSQAILLSEHLFCYQSTVFLNYLTQEPILEDDWLWGIAAMAELLDAFAYSLSEKLTLLRELRASFAHEFGMDKKLKLQLDVKYRQVRTTVEQALTQVEVSAPLLHLASQLGALGAQGLMEVSKDKLVSAYLHMLLNRLIPAEARLHELVLYDFLYRYYRSQQALQKTS